MEWTFLIIMVLEVLFINDLGIVAFTVPREGLGQEGGKFHEMKWVPNEVRKHADVLAENTKSTTNSSIESASFQGDDQMSWDFDITNFLNNLLPATGSNSGESNHLPTVVNSEKTGNAQEDKTNGSSLLDKLLENVIIDRNSIFRLQLYNSNYQRNSSSDNNDTSIVPNAIFGSPLCLGLCFTGQVYSDNGSIRVLSDKYFSLFPAASSSTSSPERANNNFPQEGESSLISAINQDPSSSSSSSTSSSYYGVLRWIPEWIYNNSFSIPRLPSVSSIPLQQYTLIPPGIIGVPDFVG